MHLSHKIQLLPTKEQKIFLAKACGVSRFTYNWALAEWQAQYSKGLKPSAFELKTQFNSIKKDQFPWIYESPKDANQQAFAFLGKAFTNFFKNSSKYPKFKKKHRKDSFYLSNDQFTTSENNVKIPLIGNIKLTEQLRFNGKIMSGTVSRHANKWFISISVKGNNYLKPRTSNNTIAIDFGLKTLITDHNGNTISRPEYKIKEKQLARYQRQYSRKQKNSNNKFKQRIKTAKIHKHIFDKRNDFNHKLTTKLCRENQTIILEDLNLNGWKALVGKSASASSIGEIRKQIFYKSKLYNNFVIILDKWNPTSKACSACGCWKDIKLSEREYNCEHCGLVMDRDLNAARNIFASGMKQIGLANPKFTPLDMGPLDSTMDLSCVVELGSSMMYSNVH